MSLSWNEVRDRAIKFSRQWAGETSERAVDRCYRPEPFPSDRQRVEYLFTQNEQLATSLVATVKGNRWWKVNG